MGDAQDRHSGRAGEILSEAAAALKRAAGELAVPTAQAAGLVVDALRAGGTIFFCGNGGSAADAQHLATELAARLRLDRPGLRALALTVNSSTLTAMANDFGYDEVFARQLQGLADAGDVLFAISTSGRSASVIRALEEARDLGVTTIGLVGGEGADMAPLCDLLIGAPPMGTQRVQEVHIAVGHAVCEIVEDELFGGADG